VLLSTFLAGCGQTESAPPDGGAPQAPEPSGEAAPSLEELANATFAGIGEEPVQLVNGGWEGEPYAEGGASRPSAGLVEDLLLTGDLDGDGNEESAVLLWTSSGGSGTFDYVAVAGRRGDTIVNLGTAELGDRVAVRGGRIAGSRLVLDVVQAGPGDAACCPTQLATRAWTLGDEGLTEGAAEITGTLSLAVLDGSEWRLTHFSRAEAAPAEPRATISFDASSVSGNAGCNSYFGDVMEDSESPGQIGFGPVGATAMMCPDEIMAVETRFLELLGSVTQYGFLAGKLVLSWQVDDTYGAMFLLPVEGDTGGS
jgi:heat shock protein HslJ